MPRHVLPSARGLLTPAVYALLVLLVTFCVIKKWLRLSVGRVNRFYCFCLETLWGSEHSNKIYRGDIRPQIWVDLCCPNKIGYFLSIQLKIIAMTPPHLLSYRVTLRLRINLEYVVSRKKVDHIVSNMGHSQRKQYHYCSQIVTIWLCLTFI